MGLIQAVSTATAFAEGDAETEFGSPEALATMGADSFADGIRLGAGNDRLDDFGTVDVDATATARVIAAASSVVGGTFAGGTANPVVSVATGIDAGAGDDDIRNMASGVVDVLAVTNANVSSSATTIFQAAEARSVATVSSVATGIMGGRGTNAITSDGLLLVQALSNATAATYSLSGVNVEWTCDLGCLFCDPPRLPSCDVDFTFGKATSVSIATAEAIAIGIETGDDSVTVSNTGILEVSAVADAGTAAVADAIVPEEVCDPFGLDICFDVPFVNPDLTEVRRATETATAIGILTGSGNDEVTNTGTITVDASSPGACPSGICTRTLSSVGIQTGGGDDTVVNAGSGTITATINGVPGSGIGIDTGDGNDLVRLLDQSVVNNVILLGDGDDVVTFAGEAQAVGIQGGSGRDTLRIEDRRTLELAPGQLIEMERYEVDQGLLVVNNDLPFNDFRAELYLGGHGQMMVNGDTFIDVADSEITIIARPRPYFDGETFDVITAGAVNGTFLTEDLTESFFLGFNVNYFPEVVQIEAGVLPFADAARTSLGRAVARYLDDIAPDADGDLAEVIGELQLLDDLRGIGLAFTSLSPESYDAYTRTAMNVSRDTSRLVQRRIASVRPAEDSGMNASMPAGMPGATNGHPARDGALGLWVGALAQWGDQDEEDGFSGFDHDTLGAVVGYDGAIGDHWLAGGSVSFSTTDIDLDDDRGSGDLDSLAGSVYGSWFDQGGWVDAVLSYGSQDYDNERQVEVGMVRRTAESDHDGNLFAALVDGGYRFDVSDAWSLSPFGRLHYISLDEDGFLETGAGDMNLVVEDRDTDSLVSEIGLRVAGNHYFKNATFVPRFSVAWVYDFDIDDRTITSRFVGAPGSSFTLDGLDQDQSRARIEAGCQLMHGRWSFSLDYYGEFGGGYEAQAVQGLAGIQF